MFNHALRGLLAGAVGTLALNVTTYADMALRGRPASDAPARLVDTVADKVGLSTSAQQDNAQKQAARNRESGLGALLGYMSGLGVGAVYGLLGAQAERAPVALAGPLVGAAAMTASDLPLFVSGVSKPKEWGFAGWAADAVPHLIYGCVTVLTYQALSGAKPARARMADILTPRQKAQIKNNYSKRKKGQQRLLNVSARS